MPFDDKTATYSAGPIIIRFELTEKLTANDDGKESNAAGNQVWRPKPAEPAAGEDDETDLYQTVDLAVELVDFTGTMSGEMGDRGWAIWNAGATGRRRYEIINLISTSHSIERIVLTSDLSAGGDGRTAAANVLDKDGTTVLVASVTVHDWGQVPSTLGGVGAKGWCVRMPTGEDNETRREILNLDCTEPE